MTIYNINKVNKGTFPYVHTEFKQKRSLQVCKTTDAHLGCLFYCSLCSTEYTLFQSVMLSFANVRLTLSVLFNNLQYVLIVLFSSS